MKPFLAIAFTTLAILALRHHRHALAEAEHWRRESVMRMGLAAMGVLSRPTVQIRPVSDDRPPHTTSRDCRCDELQREQKLALRA